MKNTVLTAKNSFLEGLIMDFSPSVTRNDCMTSALNATLLTFNGNEMSLQNDMGNGRVETAFLPEGYTPVGTCEFGDIIYIISYNPMINKALIGCFPSPERNISSDELFDSNITILSEDFLQLDSNNKPTGELKALSVKKILFDKDMHSGDLYIIYSNDNLDMSYISDFGNTDRIKGNFPKLVKISIVSIDESGKMTYIDSNVKWYNNDYYLNYCNATDSTELLSDIDSYRSLVSSAYNTFASKTPGKLALLFELERINSFDVSWECYEIETTEDYSTYDLYWNFNWETSHNDININKVILSKDSLDSLNSSDSNKLEIISELPLIGDVIFDITRHYSPEELKNYKVENITLLRLMNYDEYKEIKFDTIVSNYTTKTKVSRYITTTGKSININPGRYNYFENGEKYENLYIDDTIINNYYKIPVTKKFATFKLYHNRTGSAIFNYSLTPAMPYGKLDDLKISGYIDFDKISNTNLGINTWKYYVNDDTISLTYGLDAVVSEGKVVKDVRLEFYDNQGLAAIYSSPPRSSYNGTFTNTFTLNTKDAKLTNVKDGIVHYHTNGIYKEYNDLSTDEYNDYFVSDATHVFIKEGEYAEVDMLNVFWGTHKYDSDNDTYVLANKKAVEENEANNPTVYQNDCGILYKNQLYLVKIILTTGYNNIVSSETDTPEIFERWMWTSEIFNNEYYSKKDFIELTPELSLNVEGLYKIVPDQWNWEENILKSQEGVNQPFQGLSAISTKLNSKEPNIKLKLHVGLNNDYNMFNLWNNDTNNLNQIKVVIMEGNHSLKNYNEQPKIKYVNRNMPLLESIYPVIDSELTGEEISTDLLLYQSSNSYLYYKDSTNLSILEQEYNKCISYNMTYNEITNSYLCDDDVKSDINIETIDESISDIIMTFPCIDYSTDNATAYAYVEFGTSTMISTDNIKPELLFKFYKVDNSTFDVLTTPAVNDKTQITSQIYVTNEVKPNSGGVLQFKAEIHSINKPDNINFINKLYERPSGEITNAYKYSLNSSIWIDDYLENEGVIKSYKCMYLEETIESSNVLNNYEYNYYKCIVYTEPEYIETKELYVSDLNNTIIPEKISNEEITNDTKLNKNTLYSFNNINNITVDSNLEEFENELDEIVVWCVKTTMSKNSNWYIRSKNKEIVYLSAKAQINLFKHKLIYLTNSKTKTSFTPSSIESSKVKIYTRANDSKIKYLTVIDNKLTLLDNNIEESKLIFNISKYIDYSTIRHVESSLYLNLSSLNDSYVSEKANKFNIECVDGVYNIMQQDPNFSLDVDEHNNLKTIISSPAYKWVIEPLENNSNDEIFYKTNFTIDKVRKFKIENGKISFDKELLNVTNITEPGYYLFMKDNDFSENKNKTLSLYYTVSHVKDFSKKITYSDVNLNLIELDTSKVTSYEFDAKNLQDEEITLMLKSIKYDKYYRETDNSFKKLIKQYIIKSLLYTKEDLAEYNLTLAKTSKNIIIPMFKIGLTMGFGNMPSVDSHIERSIVNLVTPSSANFPYFDLLISDDSSELKSKVDNFIGNGWISGNGDNNISYKKYCAENLINQLVYHYNNKFQNEDYTMYDKIFFPIFLAHTLHYRGNGYDDDTKKNKWKRHNDSEELIVPEVYHYSNESSIPLNGSMSFFNKSNIYIQDEWCKGNALIYAKRLITFLRNIYYLSDTKLVDKYEPYTKNYAYLDDNYSLYTRDIITYVKSNVDNVNNILLIHSGSYSDYLEQVKQWSNNQTINTTNVTFKLKNIIKNIPFLLKLEYKTPYENINPNIMESIEVIVKSPDKTFKQTDINFLLNDGSLYGYDGNTLKPLELLKTINYNKNETYEYEFDEESSKYLLTIKNSEELDPGVLNVTNLCKYSIFNLDNFIKSDNTTVLKMKYSGINIAVPTKDTYSIKLSKNSGTDIGIINFESNLKFFKDE